MVKIKLTEEELRKLFLECKEVSDNFKNLKEILWSIPKGLRIIRMACQEGRGTFGKSCKIRIQELRRIEEGTRRLAERRIKRILSSINNKKLDFSWWAILGAHKKFTLLSEKGRFSQSVNVTISTRKRRENTILMLKNSRRMTDSEKVVFDLLSSAKIPFEREAPVFIPKSPNSRMIVVDFAIPSLIDPSMMIEVTEGRVEFIKKIDNFSHLGNKKLITGFRLKRLFPKTKLFLISKNKMDPITFALFSEAFDNIISMDEIDKLPEIIKSDMNGI